MIATRPLFVIGVHARLIAARPNRVNVDLDNVAPDFRPAMPVAPCRTDSQCELNGIHRVHTPPQVRAGRVRPSPSPSHKPIAQAECS